MGVAWLQTCRQDGMRAGLSPGKHKVRSGGTQPGLGANTAKDAEREARLPVEMRGPRVEEVEVDIAVAAEGSDRLWAKEPMPWEALRREWGKVALPMRQRRAEAARRAAD